MNTNLRLSAFILVLITYAPSVLAQNYGGLLHSARHVVGATLSARPYLGLQASYLYQPENLTIRDQSIGLAVAVDIPVFSQQAFDMDVTLSSGYLVDFTSSFKMIIGLSYGLYRTENLNGTFVNHGPKLDVFPGYYGKNWVLAAHFALDYRPFVHIKHKYYAQQAFQELYDTPGGSYTEPQEGWFTQHLHFGSYGISITYLQPQWQVNLTTDYRCPLTELGHKIIPDIGMMPFNIELTYCRTLF